MRGRAGRGEVKWWRSAARGGLAAEAGAARWLRRSARPGRRGFARRPAGVRVLPRWQRPRSVLLLPTTTASMAWPRPADIHELAQQQGAIARRPPPRISSKILVAWACPWCVLSVSLTVRQAHKEARRHRPLRATLETRSRPARSGRCPLVSSGARRQPHHLSCRCPDRDEADRSAATTPPISRRLERSSATSSLGTGERAVRAAAAT
jgi:hypothetical protein